MRRLHPLLLVFLVVGPLRAQSSQFGIRGLGIPMRPLSVRSVGTGGSFGLFDAESSLTPASISLITNIFANIQTVQNWRTSMTPTDSSSGRDQRYPGIFVGTPIGKTQLSAAISMSGYTDRNFLLAWTDTLTLRGSPVQTYDTLSSFGGISDLRAAVGWRQSAAIQWGAALHVLTGSNRLNSRRVFGDATYLGARERSTISYLGFGVSAGVTATIGRRVTLSGLVRLDDQLEVERDFIPLGHVELPTTVGGGVRIQLSERLTVAGSGLYRNWSVANADLVALGGIGSTNTTEFSAGLEYLGDPRRPARRPIRLGFRHARLPFPLQQGIDVDETGISLGSGTRFGNNRVGIDVALERIWRKGGSGFTESATLLTIGFSVRP
jgi:hypothetical protein